MLIVCMWMCSCVNIINCMRHHRRHCDDMQRRSADTRTRPPTQQQQQRHPAPFFTGQVVSYPAAAAATTAAPPNQQAPAAYAGQPHLHDSSGSSAAPAGVSVSRDGQQVAAAGSVAPPYMLHQHHPSAPPQMPHTAGSSSARLVGVTSATMPPNISSAGLSAAAAAMGPPAPPDYATHLRLMSGAASMTNMSVTPLPGATAASAGGVVDHARAASEGDVDGLAQHAQHEQPPPYSQGGGVYKPFPQAIRQLPADHALVNKRSTAAEA
eukprot:scpid98383/ scgid29530/ 